MSLVYLFFGYVLVVVVLKVTLQLRWARQLHEQYGALYSYGFIFRKIGRSHYGRFVLQPKEGLGLGFLSDLKSAQHRSFIWDIAIGATGAAIFFGWLILKRLGF